MGWVDISIPLKSGMHHWPGDPKIRIRQVRSMARGDSCNLSGITMGSHTGTHMDAPRHFIRRGRGIDQMPLDAMIGVARVIEIHDAVSIKPAELRRHRIRRGERILFKTTNSYRCWRENVFVKNFVYISVEAAIFLAKCKIRSVGVDYLSVGGYKNNGVQTHQALLKAGIWIIEGLNLSRVRPGMVELICLPLKLEHGDGAPARAVLRLRDGRGQQGRKDQ